MPTDGPTVTGERLLAGRYRLERPLGHGGMSAVWVAQDELLCRPVAVKEIVVGSLPTEEERRLVRERTLREARAAARLGHPSAVRVFDVFEHDDRPYIVMELVEGEPLSDIVRTDGPLPPDAVARMGIQLAGALAAAHEAGIVHRDVKPGNVLVRRDGHVTLTDFGIAAIAGDPSVTGTGTLVGSPAYISPERARGAAPTASSDVWALGATLFHAVEGRPPFDRGEVIPTLTAVATEPVPSPGRAGPLTDMLTRMLAKDPGQRPDLAEVQEYLRQASRPVAAGADYVPVPAAFAPATVAVPAGRPDDALRRWLVLGVLALIVFVASAAIAAWAG